MAFCPACGKEVVQGAQYCASCGSPISPVVQHTPHYFTPAPQKPSSNRNLFIIIIAIVAIVVIVGSIAAYALVSSIAQQPNILIANAQVGQPQGQYDSAGNCLGETLTFSFILVNSGSDGYAHVVLLENNQTQLWANNYLVQQGRSLPVSDSTFRQSCTAFEFRLHIGSEWKA